MFTLRRHPAYTRLSAFADGTLSDDRTQAVSRHLAACGRCRREVQVMHDMDEALRALPVPALPEDLFDRIVERREAGIRTILPSEPVAEPTRPSRIPAAAVAAVALLATGFALTMTGREATATASSLEFGPSGTVDGSVAVTYRPASWLRDQTAVRARAEVWPLDGSEPATVELGVLTPAEGGFEGVLNVPAGAGYMLIALEDPTGSAIDANAGEFWGHPGTAVGGDRSVTAEAFLAQIRAYQRLSEDGLLAASQVTLAARRATDLFPEDPRLWTKRALYELRVAASPATRESIASLHRQRLDDFVRGLDVDAVETVGAIVPLLDYADVIGQEETAARLRARLEGVVPNHRLVVEHRATERLFEEPAAPALIAGLEVDFAEVDGPSHFIVSAGYATSRAIADPEVRLRWATRLYDAAPDSRDGLAIELASDPDLRGEAIVLLEERIEFYEAAPAERRALHQSTRDLSSDVETVMARLQAALGLALVEEGQPDEALEALEESLQHRWNPTVGARVAQLLAAGSMERARGIAALVHADPLYDGPLPAIGTTLTPAEIEAAAIQLDERLQLAVRGGDAPDAVLRARTGERVSIDDGGVTLIALLQTTPDAESEEVARLANSVERLRTAGVRVLVASPEQSLSDAVEVADMVGARAVVDEDGSATEGFGGWDLWEYVVVHDGYYSVHYEVEDATRLALLRSEISNQTH